MEKGSISINTENIFPIIKKWLYSEKDIFIREIVSNASDAISKHKKLVAIGDATFGDDEQYKIEVVVDKENKTLSVIDNGIGMTADEVKTYINQIAFSGAKDFLEKYSDKAEDAQIIGHFGLGFYSSFMVSDKVEIDTLSFNEGATAVKWVSEEGMDFEMTESDRKTRGTTITMHLSDDCEEYLNEYEVRAVLNKYFSFLPFELYLINKNEESKEEDNKPLNDVSPIWINNSKECNDEDYIAFYKKTFNDFNDPLFWIHLNLDYPFRLKGVLFFPKLKHEYETIEGEIKLYYNQVFVADNVKEIIPEYLMLLKGCIDCPDLPLNVSRSFLQNDGTVKKLLTHISKKVADKLAQLHTKEKENYCKYWDDINPFVKYGCLKDDKFYDNVKDHVILKTINDEYFTVDEYLNKQYGDKEGEKTIYYVDNVDAQAQFVSIFKENAIDAVIMNTMLDTHFMSLLEMKNAGVKFKRIDTDVNEALKGEMADSLSVDAANTVVDSIKNMLDVESDEFKKEFGSLKVEAQPLKTIEIPAILQQSEEMKRMIEMSKMYGMGMDLSMIPKEEILVLNTNNEIIKYYNTLLNSGADESKIKLIAEHIYDLATLNSRQLTPERMKNFLKRNAEMLLQ